MKKKTLLLLITIILSFQCYAQIIFEQGYFVDNDDKKIDCLIKNIDWKNNPTEFEYQLSANSEKKISNIKSVKEFGISEVSKYVRAIVQIDRSSENVNRLTTGPQPEFQEEELFLKVLVEGEATLYFFEDKLLKRYFYQTSTLPIQQLVFKSFQGSRNQILKNNQFRQQLRNDLKCSTIEENRLERITYRKKELIVFFIDYNKCKEATFINYEAKVKRDLFNLTVRPGFTISSLRTQTLNSSSITDFGTKESVRFGLEAEFMLPFHKNKWAITVEPSYRSYKSSLSSPINNLAINYQSIEVPIGLRHYFFLGNHSKIFLNIGFIFDFDFDSQLISERLFSGGGIGRGAVDVFSDNNIYYGIGYLLGDKFSIEIRQFSKRDIFTNNNLSNEYKAISIIIGYRLF